MKSQEAMLEDKNDTIDKLKEEIESLRMRIESDNG